VLLVHGSSANSNSMHPLAQSLTDAGYTVYALDIRGHGQSGVKGQVAYIGQLDDDLEDFIKATQPARPRTLLGFSSGGGFVLRVAGSPRGLQFDNFLLLAPYLHYKASTNRSGAAAAWASVGLPRMVALVLLNRLGLRSCNDLPVLDFAVSDSPRADLVRQYSYALALSFQPQDDYRAGLRAIARPAELIVGGDDELFLADQYRPLLDEAGRSDIPVAIVPATGHIKLTLSTAGRAAAVAAVRRLDAGVAPGH
jgi:alpha-beta hydrolase superfamily lysophospholipase